MKVDTPGRIALFLAALWLALCVLLAGGAWGQARLVLVGDSITAGACDSSVGTTSLAHKLQSSIPHVRVLDYSRGGWAVADGWSWIDAAPLGCAASLWPKLVVLLIGTNDYGANIPLDTFRAEYRVQVAHAGYFGSATACVTPIWRSGEGVPNGVGATLDDYRRVIREECPGVVIDARDAIPQEARYYCDGLHPTRLGIAQYARFLASALKKVLP